MRTFSIVIISLLCTNYAITGQPLNKPPIPIGVIEKGLQDFDYFRKYLVDYGLSYDYKYEKNDGGISEYWCLRRRKQTKESASGLNYHCPIRIIIGSYFFEGKPWHNQIIIQLNKEEFYEYAEKFKNNIKIAFPESKLEPIYGNSIQDIDYYGTMYSRINSKVTVLYWTQEDYYEFDFEFHYISF